MVGESVLYAVTALVLVALALWLGRMLLRRPTLGTAGAWIVTLGLVYDNAVVAAGASIGAGPTLQTLNWLRYLIHALATPLLIVFAHGLALRAGLAWSRRQLDPHAGDDRLRRRGRAAAAAPAGQRRGRRAALRLAG